MIAAGIGCRSGASAEDIDRALTTALCNFGIDGGEVVVIATENSKASEPGINAVARRHAIPIETYSPEQLNKVGDKLLSPSDRVLSLKGTASVAEAAAILAAGGNARLLGPRIKTPKVTCALAIGEGRGGRNGEPT